MKLFLQFNYNLTSIRTENTEKIINFFNFYYNPLKLNNNIISQEKVQSEDKAQAIAEYKQELEKINIQSTSTNNMSYDQLPSSKRKDKNKFSSRSSKIKVNKDKYIDISNYNKHYNYKELSKDLLISKIIQSAQTEFHLNEEIHNLNKLKNIKKELEKNSQTENLIKEYNSTGNQSSETQQIKKRRNSFDSIVSYFEREEEILKKVFDENLELKKTLESQKGLESKYETVIEMKRQLFMMGKLFEEYQENVKRLREKNKEIRNMSFKEDFKAKSKEKEEENNLLKIALKREEEKRELNMANIKATTKLIEMEKERREKKEEELENWKKKFLKINRILIRKQEKKNAI